MTSSLLDANINWLEQGVVVSMTDVAIIVAGLNNVVCGLLWPLMPFIIVPSVAAAVLWLVLGYWDEFASWRNFAIAMCLVCLCSLFLLWVLLPGIILIFRGTWWVVSLVILGWIWLTYRLVLSMWFFDWVCSESSMPFYQGEKLLVMFQLLYGLLLRLGPASLDLSYAMTFVTAEFLEDIYKLVSICNPALPISVSRTLQSSINVALPDEFMSLAYTMARGDTVTFAKTVVKHGWSYTQLYASNEFCNKAGRQYMNCLLQASGMQNIFFALLGADNHHFGSALTKLEPWIGAYKLETPKSALYMIGTASQWKGVGDLLFLQNTFHGNNTWKSLTQFSMKAYEFKLTRTTGAIEMAKLFHQQQSLRGQYLIVHHQLENALIAANLNANSSMSEYVGSVKSFGWNSVHYPHKRLNYVEWMKTFRSAWELNDYTSISLARSGMLTEDDVEGFVEFTQRTSLADYRTNHKLIGTVLNRTGIRF
jgi:hypothetical protein